MNSCVTEDAAAEALLDRIAGRDESALAELYDDMAGSVYGVAERILNDPALAEDATIDVFLHVWNRATDFRASRGSAVTWVLLVARSRAIDALRKRGRATRFETTLPDDHVSVPVALHVMAPETPEATDERNVRVHAALARIAPEERRAVWSSFFLGLSHRQIAERLAEPLGTVKTRIRSGLAKLERLLQPLENRT